jgi:NADH dehydrogenase FAD-containing subunit
MRFIALNPSSLWGADLPQWRRRVGFALFLLLKLTVVCVKSSLFLARAAEIKAALPAVRVTLLHSGPRLLSSANNSTDDGFTPAFHATLMAKLALLGVETKLNVRATPPPGLPQIGGVICDPTTVEAVAREGGVGGSFQADVSFWFLGTRPVTDVVASSFPGSLDAGGFVRVDATLALVGQPTVFVAGDATPVSVTKAPKTAVAAEIQVWRALDSELQLGSFTCFT